MYRLDNRAIFVDHGSEVFACPDGCTPCGGVSSIHQRNKCLVGAQFPDRGQSVLRLVHYVLCITLTAGIHMLDTVFGQLRRHTAQLHRKEVFGWESSDAWWLTLPLLPSCGLLSANSDWILAPK